MTPKNYILVCDERGTTRWPSKSKTWALGGFTLDATKQKKVEFIWNDIKTSLCGDASCELKWMHFFPGHHQEKGDNPLISNNPSIWRDQASWAIDQIFEIPGIVPASMYVRKDKASEYLFKKNDLATNKRYKILDIDIIHTGVFGQFALFLKNNQATGEIWFDKLGSAAEEKRRQESWAQLLCIEWKVNPENQQVLKRISPQLKFLDSSTNPLVQVADFISGVIWAASEGDDKFLYNALEKYFPHGPNTFTLLHLT